MKALYRNADILILDEPTARLTPQEASDLFEILRTLRREGISIIFISHKLNEVLDIADRITVLRRGKTIETVPRTGATRGSRSPARWSVATYSSAWRRSPRSRATSSSRCETSTFGTTARSRRCRGVSFDVRAGEIVGIAGVDGNGQTELIDALTGLQRIESGTVTHRRSRTLARRTPGRRSTPESGTFPRTASGAGSCSTSRSPRTSRCTTTRSRRLARVGWLFPRRMVERARSPDPRVRRPRRRARTRARGACRAAISRSSWPRGRSRRDPRSSSLRSPRAGSMSARSSTSIAGWSRSATRAGRSFSSHSNSTRSCRSPTESS